MGCFCADGTRLRAALESLDSAPSSPPEASPAEASPAGDAVTSAAGQLAARGLPAAPWQPDPAWLETPVPTPKLDASAVATLSGLANMRSAAQSQLGVDVLAPGTGIALARIVATMNARMAAITNVPDPAPWQKLADQNDAADRVIQQLGSSASTEEYANPAGQPMAVWKPFLRQVRAMAPLIAATGQLDVSADDPPAMPAAIATAVRSLRAVELPPIDDPQTVARLIALSSAVTRLQQSLGADPVRDGFAAVQDAVARKVAEAAERLADKGSPANVPYCPSAIAPPAVVTAACSEGGRQIAGIAWHVPPASSFPAIRTVSLTAALVAQITAATGTNPVRSSPCSNCDARQILASASARVAAGV